MGYSKKSVKRGGRTRTKSKSVKRGGYKPKSKSVKRGGAYGLEKAQARARAQQQQQQPRRTASGEYATIDFNTKNTKKKHNESLSQQGYFKVEGQHPSNQARHEYKAKRAAAAQERRKAVKAKRAQNVNQRSQYAHPPPYRQENADNYAKRATADTDASKAESNAAFAKYQEGIAKHGHGYESDY